MARIKRKTHKATAKRFKVSSTGKVLRGRAGMSHLMSTKSGKRRLRLRRGGTVDTGQLAVKIRRLLGKS